MTTPEWKQEEKAVSALRSLYRQYGYRHYKMSKFEEYDLYGRNKEFLISDSVITFTDTNGKLMALKPDVTLSIIKNGQDTPDGLQKVFYDEHVYRVSKGTHTFKELKQVGLECVGAVDTYAVYEVLMLAARSLSALGEDCVLDISHLGIVSVLLDDLALSAEDTRRALQYIGDKNRHELAALCAAAGADATKSAVLEQLMSLYGTPSSVLPQLKALVKGTPAEADTHTLETVVAALAREGLEPMLRLNFSVINDRNYYNGFVFKGFINGISSGVLSGGQYDRLMRKMGRRAEAIGFAVYMDLLEERPAPSRSYDVDTVLVYDETADLAALQETVRRLTAEGRDVLTVRAVPEKLTYRQRLVWNGKEAVTVG